VEICAILRTEVGHFDMMMRAIFIGAATLALSTSATSVSASILYDNGPSTYDVNAWNIDQGFAVADSFVLSSAATVNGLDFTTWTFGVNLTGVDWGIYDADPFSGGTLLAGGTASPTTTFLFTNGFGYDISDQLLALTPTALTAGTYWIELSNATPGGESIFWDESDGPSAAEQTGTGPTGSHDFRILGTTGAVPEPANWAMMIAGFGLIGGALRSRRMGALTA
jgi:hypothetical protein